MKQLLFVFTVACISASAQSKIEGIGRFKILKTKVSVIDSILSETSYAFNKVSSMRDFYQKSTIQNSICELTIDTNTTSQIPFSHYCKWVKTFFIPKIKIADIPISNVYLTFYKDTLIEFKCDGSIAISEALDLKYGQSKVTKTEKKSTCTLKSIKESMPFIETTYFSTWGTGDVTATGIVSDYRDSDCEKKVMNSLHISSLKYGKEIYTCDDKEEAILRAKAEERKRKKLTDF